MSTSMASQSRASQSNIGTPIYRAPELWHTPGKAASTKSDVYALAVLMWEILTREIPLHQVDNSLFGLYSYWSEFKKTEGENPAGENPAFELSEPSTDEPEVVHRTFTLLAPVVRDGLNLSADARPEASEVVARLGQ